MPVDKGRMVSFDGQSYTLSMRMDSHKEKLCPLYHIQTQTIRLSLSIPQIEAKSSSSSIRIIIIKTVH